MDCPGGCCKNGMCCRNGTCSRSSKSHDRSSGGKTNTSGMVCKNGMCHRALRNNFWGKDSTQQNKENRKWPGANPTQFWELSSTPHHGDDERATSARNNFWEIESQQQYSGSGGEAYWNQPTRNSESSKGSRNQYWETETSQYGGTGSKKREMDSGTMYRNANSNNAEQAHNWYYGSSQNGNKQQYQGEGNYTSAPQQQQYWQYGGSDSSPAPYQYYDGNGTCPALRHNNSSGMAEALQWHMN